MNRKGYSLFHLFVQKIASSRPAAWFLSRTLHHFDRAFLKLTGRRMSLTTVLAGLPVVTVTTVGVKSGVLRTVPLGCIRDERDPNTFALIASNWGQDHHPAWYFNLKACPRATGSISGRTAEYVAHEASGEEYERFWQRAVDAYMGFPLYQQRAGKRHIPIMVMCPVPQQAA